MGFESIWHNHITGWVECWSTLCDDRIKIFKNSRSELSHCTLIRKSAKTKHLNLFSVFCEITLNAAEMSKITVRLWLICDFVSFLNIRSDIIIIILIIHHKSHHNHKFLDITNHREHIIPHWTQIMFITKDCTAKWEEKCDKFWKDKYLSKIKIKKYVFKISQL